MVIYIRLKAPRSFLESARSLGIEEDYNNRMRGQDMGKEELIVSFQDTFEKSNNGSLKQRTARAVKSNRVYKEGFVSEVKRCNESASIDVYSGTTFDVAKRYRALGKVAVLNFANPETPGGRSTIWCNGTGRMFVQK